MAPADRRIYFRREAQVAAATVRAADVNDHRPATHVAESIVRGKKGPRDGLAERRSAFFEREGEPVDQPVSP